MFEGGILDEWESFLWSMGSLTKKALMNTLA